ncbi:hypothetical protein GCM10010388_74320 [Streptomyces mauvecolor]
MAGVQCEEGEQGAQPGPRGGGFGTVYAHRAEQEVAHAPILAEFPAPLEGGAPIPGLRPEPPGLRLEPPGLRLEPPGLRLEPPWRLRPAGGGWLVAQFPAPLAA